ncbi:hypothetical protein HDU77_001187 [Chytriomyces hyalinus]|nr:hypothetical protein HDU77_001187 [Chytriomyces hyalinus]
MGSAGSAGTASSATPTTTDPTTVASTPTTSVTPAGPPQSVFSFSAPALLSTSVPGMQSNRISNQFNTPAAPINWQQRAEAAEAATASLQTQMQSLTALVTQLVMFLQQGSANVVQPPGTANVAQPLSTAAAFLASISPTPTTTTAAAVPGVVVEAVEAGLDPRIVPGAAPAPSPTDPITVTVENPSPQVAEATWTTVARNGARRVPPPPREPRQSAPQTQQQYDESVHRSRQKRAIKMAKAVPEPKEFAVLHVELHSSRQLHACSLRERKHLINAFVGQMSVRHNVALTSSIGNSIIELYCPTDVVLDVAKVLRERGQQVLTAAFNPLAFDIDGKPLDPTQQEQAAKRLAALCKAARTVNLRAAILAGAPQSLKEATQKVFETIRVSPSDSLLAPPRPHRSASARFAAPATLSLTDFVPSAPVPATPEFVDSEGDVSMLAPNPDRGAAANAADQQ